MTVEAWYLQPNFFFHVTSFVNLLNYLDRSIIPGSINQINDFIQKDLNTDQPDIFVGFLQAAFVVGFVVGFVLFGKLIPVYSRFTITGIGCSVWIIASLMSGISFYSGSYVFLFFSRVLSGFCEASMQCTIPPWIQSTAPPAQRGKWLGIFYTAIPVGTALGYAYSAAFSETAGWEWAFFVEAIVMLPFVLFMFFIAKYYPVGSTGPIEPAEDVKLTLVPNFRSHVEAVSAPAATAGETVGAVIGQPVFLWLTLSVAAQIGVMVGISTFGASILVGLGFFNQQAAASSAFGTVLLLSGLVGTPIGGLMLDRLLGHLSTAGESPAQRNAALHRIALFAIAMTSAGLATLCLGLLANDAGAFLFALGVGVALMVTINPATNMAVMLCVDPQHRVVAIAANILCLHVFGDVPAPIIVGLIKDRLAPNCSQPANSDDDNISATSSCRDEADGLRNTMRIVELWLLWVIVAFAAIVYLTRGGHSSDGDDSEATKVLEVENPIVRVNPSSVERTNELVANAA